MNWWEKARGGMAWEKEGEGFVFVRAAPCLGDLALAGPLGQAGSSSGHLAAGQLVLASGALELPRGGENLVSGAGVEVQKQHTFDDENEIVPIAHELWFLSFFS